MERLERYIRSVQFVSAQTDDEKLAIQICPWYDGTLAKALGDYHEDKDMKYLANGCPKQWSCKVSLHFTPLIDQLTIFGKCLME